MTISEPSLNLLLLGESDVGKTHYGAQLLLRLRAQTGSVQMAGAASNLAPFEAALQSLNEGHAAPHTSAGLYSQSDWPIKANSGRLLRLQWPDYAGEQIRQICKSRIVPPEWAERIRRSHAWIFMIRLQRVLAKENIFTRPLSKIHGHHSPKPDFALSEQARFVEFLQILRFVRRAGFLTRIAAPRLCILLSCWDEIGDKEEGSAPSELLKHALPMLYDFLTANWSERGISVYGLSALGRPLNESSHDSEFIAHGPLRFGYLVDQQGRHVSDLALPISELAAAIEAG